MADRPLIIVSWSGGKDSTATVILAHKLGIPIDLILTAFVMFDRERGICGENPKKTDWMVNHAIPVFKSWGYPVEIVSSDKDYLYWFNKVRYKSKNPENIGKRYGFPIGGFCKMQGEKVAPIKKRIKDFTQGRPYTEIVGICADEPERLERMKERNQISLLADNGMTQADAKKICQEYGLLSPTYTNDKNRDGCWFCPNQRIAELAETKVSYPSLWSELEELAKVKDTVARGFKYGTPFTDVAKEVDAYIQSLQNEQISLFD